MKITNTLDIPMTTFEDLPCDSWFLNNNGLLCYKSGLYEAFVFDGEAECIDITEISNDERDYLVTEVEVEIRILPLKKN